MGETQCSSTACGNGFCQEFTPPIVFRTKNIFVIIHDLKRKKNQVLEESTRGRSASPDTYENESLACPEVFYFIGIKY